MIRYDGAGHRRAATSGDHGLGPARAAPARVAHRAELTGGDGRVPRRPAAARDRRRRAGRADRRTRASTTSPTSEFTSICDLCWKMLDRTAGRRAPGPADRRDQHRAGPTPMSTGTAARGCGRSSSSPTRSVRATLGAASGASPHVRELYPVYLATMHGVVRSAVPLMEAAHRSGAALARRRARRAPDRRTSSTTRPRRPATTSGCWRTSRRVGGDPAQPRAQVPSAQRRDAGRRAVLLAAPRPPGLAARPHGRDGGLLADARVRRPPAGADRLSGRRLPRRRAATRSSTSSTNASSTRRSTRCR